VRDLLTVELCDGVEPDRQARATVAIASGLPEVLTPLPLAVVSQLVALHVAMSKRLDPDAPRRLRKVTRTW
jgi:fructoselysine-6-P-deglycase FrlB-like protein